MSHVNPGSQAEQKGLKVSIGDVSLITVIQSLKIGLHVLCALSYTSFHLLYSSKITLWTANVPVPDKLNFGFLRHYD